MGVLFEGDFLDGFGTWPLAYIPYGGPDFGELSAVAQAVGGGGVDAYYAAWMAAGDRTLASAEAASKAGHRASARDLYLKAERPLCGRHTIRSMARRSIRGWSRLSRSSGRRSTMGLRLAIHRSDPKASPSREKPCRLTFSQQRDLPGRRRPTIIFTNGYDGTITDMFFASAVAASRRGYHALLFDGPGQGAMLYRAATFRCGQTGKR